MKNIPKEIIENTMTYSEYRALIGRLMKENKTTGSNHSEYMMNYAKLNIARMNKWDKRAKLTPETETFLSELNQPLLWLVITEGWCGDAAQIVPVLEKMATASPLIEMKLVLRDENLSLMDAFLTNGGRSIPKVIIIDPSDNRVLGSWGPRPQEMQDMILDNKAKAQLLQDDEKNRLNTESAQNLHLWYAKDKTRTAQQEFVAANITALSKTAIIS